MGSFIPALAAAPSAAEAPVTLSPLHVTSTAVTESPLQVTLDPKAAAQPIPAQDGADILKAVPGFAVSRKGGTDGDPVLRGMAGSRLGILLDDECVLGGCGNRMDPPTAYAFPAAYDKVTIIKGPQTVIHGPGTSAGVVLFERVPKRLESRSAELQSSLTGGSFGRFDGLVDAMAGIPEVQLHATGTYTRSDDYQDGAGRAVHSSYARWSTHADLDWTPTAKTFVSVSGALSDGEAAYADRSMDGVKFKRENQGFRARQETDLRWVKAVEVRAYRNYIDHVMDNYSLRPFVASSMMPAPAVSNPDRLTTGASFRSELQPVDRLSLVLGVDSQRNQHTVRSTMNQTLMPYEAKARGKDGEFRQWGPFAESTWTLTKDTRVIAGARGDQWKAIDSRQTVALSMMSSVPNPGANHVRESGLYSGFARAEHDLRFAPGTLTVFAGAGQTQRFPDYWELIKNESASSVSAFGTQPETTHQLDAGALFKGRSHELSVSLFAADISDFILVQSNYAKPAGMMGTRMAVISRNVDASTYGGEVSWLWRLAEHWRWDASLATVHGTNETDSRPLGQMSPLEGRMVLTYETSDWSVGGVCRAVARQGRYSLNQGNIVGQDLGPTAGFSVFSLNAAYRIGAHYHLALGIDNLFDKTYAEHISRAGASVAGFVQATRVNEPGRVFWLKMEAKF